MIVVYVIVALVIAASVLSAMSARIMGSSRVVADHHDADPVPGDHRQGQGEALAAGELPNASTNGQLVSP